MKQIKMDTQGKSFNQQKVTVQRAGRQCFQSLEISLVVYSTPMQGSISPLYCRFLLTKSFHSKESEKMEHVFLLRESPGCVETWPPFLSPSVMSLEPLLRRLSLVLLSEPVSLLLSEPFSEPFSRQEHPYSTWLLPAMPICIILSTRDLAVWLSSHPASWAAPSASWPCQSPQESAEDSHHQQSLGFWCSAQTSR